MSGETMRDEVRETLRSVIEQLQTAQSDLTDADLSEDGELDPALDEKLTALWHRIGDVINDLQEIAVTP